MSAALPSRSQPEAVRIDVSLGERSYPILVGRGVSEEAAGRLADLGASAVALVTDDNVRTLHAAPLAASLEAAGIRVSEAAVRPGENSKSFGGLAHVCDAMLGARLERRDVVVAVGGGVVGDLAGFAAAIIKRGVRFVQVPTTLLAQVDSSVGGKTGINTPAGKNLVGAFHQPSLVLADTALLDTLPAREMRAGYAEVAKYGLIDDPDFFGWCETNWRGIFSGSAAREHAVAHSCRAKAAIVSRDEREEGDRALLNLGHTFAHALESLVGYDGVRLVHGEAVAIGLCLAFRFSAGLGLAPPADAERVTAHLRDVGLPTRLAEVPGGSGSAEALLSAMAQDKKVQNGRLTFILARGIGRSFVARDVPAGDVGDFLRAELAA